MITRRPILTGLAALASSPALARTAPSLSEIVDRHVRARGGASALDSIRTLESALRVTEPTFQVDGRYLASTDGLVRVDIYAEGKRVFSEGVDAEGVWGMGGDGKLSPANEKGRQALLHGVEYNLVGLHRFPERGQKLSLVGREAFNGADRYVVQVDFADGFEVRFYIDPQSWMIVGRRDRRAYHPDVDSTEKRIESRFSDFRRVNGVVHHFLSEDYDMVSGLRIGRGETFWIKHNPDLGDRIPRTATPQPPPPRTL